MPPGSFEVSGLCVLYSQGSAKRYRKVRVGAALTKQGVGEMEIESVK